LLVATPADRDAVCEVLEHIDQQVADVDISIVAGSALRAVQLECILVLPLTLALQASTSPSVRAVSSKLGTFLECSRGSLRLVTGDFVVVKPAGVGSTATAGGAAGDVVGELGSGGDSNDRRAPGSDDCQRL
jgi:hypothetical protein